MTESSYCLLNGDAPPDYPVKLKPFPIQDEDPPAAVAVAAPAPRRMPVAYVSGPYRDARGTYYVEQNIRRAEAAAVELWQLGFAVVCPHTNTKHMDGAVDADTFISGDLELVRRSDVVVMLPGWKNSLGAQAEWRVALATDALVLYWDRPLDRALLHRIGRLGRDDALVTAKRDRAELN